MALGIFRCILSSQRYRSRRCLKRRACVATSAGLRHGPDKGHLPPPVARRIQDRIGQAQRDLHTRNGPTASPRWAADRLRCDRELASSPLCDRGSSSDCPNRATAGSIRVRAVLERSCLSRDASGPFRPDVEYTIDGRFGKGGRSQCSNRALPALDDPHPQVNDHPEHAKAQTTCENRTDDEQRSEGNDWVVPFLF